MVISLSYIASSVNEILLTVGCTVNYYAVIMSGFSFVSCYMFSQFLQSQSELFFSFGSHFSSFNDVVVYSCMLFLLAHLVRCQSLYDVQIM